MNEDPRGRRVKGRGVQISDPFITSSHTDKYNSINETIVADTFQDGSQIQGI